MKDQFPALGGEWSRKDGFSSEMDERRASGEGLAREIDAIPLKPLDLGSEGVAGRCRPTGEDADSDFILAE
jgi:hypothetical protein